MSKLISKSKSITKTKPAEDIMDYLTHCKAKADPIAVLEEADKLRKKNKDGSYKLSPEDNMFKAITLVEFENGPLLTSVVKEQYQTFGIDMMRQLQKDYSCTSITEKSITELITISYIRTLEIQGRINSFLSTGTLTGEVVSFLAVMSKELDRAHRHYLTALQLLRTIKQPPMQVKINAETAIVGQNQIVQSNHD